MEQDKPPLRYDDPERLDDIDNLDRSGPSHPYTPSHVYEKSSFLEEMIPSPTSSSDPIYFILRRSGSLAVLIIFIISIIFLALTNDVISDGSAFRLKHVFGYGVLDDSGGAGWVADDVSMSSGEKELGLKKQVDFDRYINMRSISEDDIKGKRVIFIGDVHGSYEPLM
jgi:hypothetical protein